EGGPNNETLDGGPGNDTFIGSGGAYTVTGGEDQDVIVLPGTAANDTFNLALDNSGLRRILATVNGITSTYQAAGGGDILAAGIDKITVDAGDGSDNLFVDLTNGTFPSPLDPQFEAGPGNDRLFLSGGTATFDNYTLFPTSGFGQSQIVMAGVNQFITNRDIEEVD